MATPEQPDAQATVSPEQADLQAEVLYVELEERCHAQDIDLSTLEAGQLPDFTAITRALLFERAKTGNKAANLLLPPGPVTHNLRLYYSAFKPGEADKVRQERKKRHQMNYLPTAIRYQQRFREIGAAYELETLLEDKDQAVAADGLFDLLTAYGHVVADLINASAANRAERERIRKQRYGL